MGLVMRDEAIKTQLFRFVDALPSLKTGPQIARHLQEYLLIATPRMPTLLGTVVKWLPTTGWPASLLAMATQFQVRRMAEKFVAASDVVQAMKVVESLRHRRLAFTIDLLGEAVVSEVEADAYQKEYLSLLQQLPPQLASLPRDELLDRDSTGSLPRCNVSVKLSSLYSQFDPIDPQGTAAAVLQRLRPILRSARQSGSFVNLDMEQRAFKDLTLRLFKTVLLEDEFKDWPNVGIAIQAYLKSTENDLKGLADWAKLRGTPVWVRLVKGAYWDFESVIAAQNGWPNPVFTDKAQTDANFELCTDFLMQQHQWLRPAIASHNIRSIAAAMALAEKHGVPPPEVEFQMLFGMADAEKSAVASMGRRVRVYMPVGRLLPGMAYLIRRLLENTSNESFLRAGFLEHVPEERLLMNPLMQLRKNRVGNPRPREFQNESPTDFSVEANRLQMFEALAAAANEAGRDHLLLIDGKRIRSEGWINSINPSHKTRMLDRCAKATSEHARQVVAAAKNAFGGWRDTPASERAALLDRVADILHRDRLKLAAREIAECGKPWREADADVAEAIDFCRYYAWQMRLLAQPNDSDIPGEQNQWLYEPRGVAVVISPWNFPLAILCGMTAAAIVTGNPVIMKPAEQSSIIAAKLAEAYVEADAPPGVVNYLPGIGEEIGPILINHPDVALIAFTGSRAVGLSINQQASATPPGQDHVKRIIAEMGGKNAIIIDDDADLDEAVGGVVSSAFGYAGQKCSACSRAIVLSGIYDLFLSRLIQATRSLKIGPAEDPAARIGPVIDAEAFERIRGAIEKGRADASLVYSGDPGILSDEGFFIPPHIFADVPRNSFLATEEIFGPVLSVMKANDLGEALSIANGGNYALTGGIYSRSPATLERCRREFRVGNLYINRKITGALVGRQPFGGFKLSGAGTQAGGPDYLRHFMMPRCITENTLRHGFAPADGSEPE